MKKFAHSFACGILFLLITPFANGQNRSSIGVIPIPKLLLTENFETTPWSPRAECPYGGCCLGRGCFDVLGCNNGGNMFVRLFSNNGKCGYSGKQKVKTWTGGGTLFHGNSALSGQWVLTQLPPYLSFQKSAHIGEILTSRFAHRNGSGKLSAEFFIHGPNVTANHNEHYAVMHNLNITGIPKCSRDCDNLPGAYATQGEADINQLFFYGVIAGNFGNESLIGVEGCRDKVNGIGCRGFIVEIRTREGVYLPAKTFIPYTENGEFPANRWYQIEINWNRLTGVYSYSVKTLRSTTWQLIGSRSVNQSVFLEGGRTLLPPGLIGATGVWGEASRGSDVVHLDWDNISVDW